MPSTVITVSNLGKRYIIGQLRSKEDGLRHKIESILREPVKWLKQRRKKAARKRNEFWALRNISFDVEKGEVVGIIGRNGAGKSTLLKLLSQITEPTEGRIRIRGRIASLLEVGTGFHQELTGRENIFLNGAILGMTHTEITARFDEIVAFSEINEFLDTPVKRYSSGMYVRLAFAVAAHLEPEILIVDEVLAVGDASFQRKCLGKMGDIAGSGKTVFFVSHNMEAIRSLCQRVICLKDGHVYADGPADEVIQDYFNNVSDKNSFSIESIEYGITITRVTLENKSGTECVRFSPGDNLIVSVSFDARIPIDEPYITIGVVGTNGPCFTANMLLDGCRPHALTGPCVLKCSFSSIPLLPQNYLVKMGIWTSNGRDVILKYQEVASFNVVADLTRSGFKGEFLSRAAHYTSVVVPYEWHLPDGTISSISLLKSPK